MEADQTVARLAGGSTAGLLDHLADLLCLRVLHPLLVGVHAEKEEHQDDDDQGDDGDFFGIHWEDFLR
ncbi:MAG: hypothetical protein RLZ63_2346 [Pseudomonadota bacterium]